MTSVSGQRRGGRHHRCPRLIDRPSLGQDRQSQHRMQGAQGHQIHPLYAYVVLLVTTGLRTEELRALRWNEVDLDAGTVAVYRALRATSDAKTPKSRHVLSLPRLAVRALQEHLDRGRGQGDPRRRYPAAAGGGKRRRHFAARGALGYAQLTQPVRFRAAWDRPPACGWAMATPC